MTPVTFTTIAQPNPRALLLIEIPPAVVARNWVEWSGI
jgi:hypothetical protein